MATRKPATPTDEKFTNVDLNIIEVLEAIDRKDYGYYDRLTEEQKKKFVPYLVVQWLSSVDSRDLNVNMFSVMSTEFHANKHLFNERVQQHPKLQWLMLCSASTGTKQYHKWIPSLKEKIAQLKEKASTKDVTDHFKKMYPQAAEADVKAFSEQFTIKQNHKYRLAKMYPHLKMDEIDLLSTVVTSRDIDKYEEESGN